MKKFKLFCALAILATACQNEPDEKSQKTWDGPQYHLEEIEVNRNVVYAVIIKDVSEKHTARGYSVQLKLGDKVWVDTLHLDLPEGDTVQSEIIFADAIIDDNGAASLSVSTFETR